MKDRKNKQQQSKGLNPQQELFCRLYVKDGECFGNATQAYIHAYGITPVGQEHARKAASRLVTKVDILARIEALLDECLDHKIVDRELAKLILQNKDLSVKVAAIREYNRIRERVTEKLSGNFVFSWEK